MERRTVLTAGLATLAAPALGAEQSRVLRFVPYVDLPLLDPVINTASQVRTHAFLVWDTLYGLDADYVARPQMVAGHRMEDDGRTWVLTLRDGLRFHDGTPVLARDAVASIRRWAGIDGFGRSLMAAVDVLDAPDDRTVRFRMQRAFPLLPDALGKMSPSVLPIMPERLAATPATKAVAEVVGSGPFRFVAAERVPGSRLVYERFADYVPGAGAAGFTSGAKTVHFDRVEWLTMPEGATAMAALQTGDVDWVEAPPPDLLPPLRRERGLAVRTNDTTGVVPILRFNTLHPPFDNVAVRRAVLSAVNQREFLSAFSGDDTLWQAGFVAFCPGTPFASDAGLERVGSASVAEAARAVQAAGYAGERVVMLGPTDHPVNSVMAQVGADLLKRLGFNVDYQAMDAGTMFQRRNSREPLDRGGWSLFPSAVAGIDVLNPAVSFLVRGNGRDAWYGWPEDPALERLRLAWFDAADRAAQVRLCREMQVQLMDQAPYLPLGQILQPTAYRRDLVDMLPGFAKFWGVRRA